MLQTLFTSLAYYIPEAICVVLMCLLLVAESMHKEEGTSRDNVYMLAMGGLLLSLVFLICGMGNKPVSIFSNAVVIDSFSTYAKIIMVMGTLGTVWLSRSSKDIYSNLKSEFSIMAVGVLIGGMLLASANNMLTLYLGIETLSVLSYVMSSFKREDAASTEAGMKYALYGGITAGVMLFGMSHIYGILGTIQFSEIIKILPTISGDNQVLLMVAFLMFFAGIGYKISCFPFHMWSPDVYQGSPIPVTAFFAIVPKMAGLAVIIRVSMIFFNTDTALSQAWIGLLHIVAALTMAVGNISAIGQDSVKRLLAFSSIGHVGMMIMGVLVLNEVGITAILFYALTYVFMTLVAFYVTSKLNDTYGTDSQTSFRGLIHKHPMMAIMMSIALFSLAGLPPLSGFVAKFNILSVVIDKKYYGIAFVAAINSVIGLYYYMKLVKEMILGKLETAGEIEGFTAGSQALIMALTIPIVLLGIFWGGAMNFASSAHLFLGQ